MVILEVRKLGFCTVLNTRIYYIQYVSCNKPKTTESDRKSTGNHRKPEVNWN